MYVYCRYGFDPVKLVSQLVDILLRIVQQETSKTMGFVQSLSTDADYNSATLQKVLSVIRHKSATVSNAAVIDFEQLLNEVRHESFLMFNIYC